MKLSAYILKAFNLTNKPGNACSEQMQGQYILAQGQHMKWRILIFFYVIQTLDDIFNRPLAGSVQTHFILNTDMSVLSQGVYEGPLCISMNIQTFFKNILTVNNVSSS